MEQCALREAWAANKQAGMLPVWPQSRLGSVIHKILELANKGLLTNRASAQAEWESALLATETRMQESWLDRALTPLIRNVRDLEVQRLRMLRGVDRILNDRHKLYSGLRAETKTGTGSELWVQSQDARVGGFIDYAFLDGGDIVLRDYKSGVLHERLDSGDRAVKEAYVLQLKLYAALYNDSFGVWPIRAELSPLQGGTIEVPIDKKECGVLLERAGFRLIDTNAVLESANDLESQIQALARPTPASCGSCLYRPRCGRYEGQVQAEPHPTWPKDIVGVVERKQILNNGRICFSILPRAGRPVLLRQLDPSETRHPALRMLKVGDRIAAYNMQPGRQEFEFTEKNSTILYQLQ